MTELFSALIGLGLGIFLTFGSAYILKKVLDSMKQKVEAKNMSWSLAQAAGLASLWTSKLLVAALAIYFAIKAGYSAIFIGLFVPIGIAVAALLIRRFSREKSA